MKATKQSGVHSMESLHNPLFDLPAKTVLSTKPGKDLLTELRESLGELLDNATAKARYISVLEGKDVEENEMPDVALYSPEMIRAKSVLNLAHSRESELVGAAKLVLANWEKGNLAWAVNLLSAALNKVEGSK